MSCKRSKIWDFFEINSVDENKVNCLQCQAKINRGGKDARSYTCILYKKNSYLNGRGRLMLVYAI